MSESQCTIENMNAKLTQLEKARAKLNEELHTTGDWLIVLADISDFYQMAQKTPYWIIPNMAKISLKKYAILIFF